MAHYNICLAITWKFVKLHYNCHHRQTIEVKILRGCSGRVVHQVVTEAVFARAFTKSHKAPLTIDTDSIGCLHAVK